MSERDGYAAGVPCWVDTWREDVNPAAAFYGELFGWNVVGTTAAGEDAYAMCLLRERQVAGIGSPLPAAARKDPAAWTTYVQVDGVEETVAKVREAGGSVLAEPFDSLDGGRIAIIADPSGAVLGVWQLGEHAGAELVNEPSAWAMSFLMSPDPDAAARFYGAVFGWETESFGPATMFRLPGFVGGEPSQPVPRDVVATMMPAAEGPPAAWGVNFWVADVDGVAAKTKELGGQVISAPEAIEGLPMKEGVIADPEGAVLSVTQLLVPPQAG